MFSHSLLRPLVGLPLAALIVFGLFRFMQVMTDTDFEPPQTSEQRVLEAFTLPEQETAEPRPRRAGPEKLDLADRPPPPPKVTAGNPDISLPVSILSAAAPDAPAARLEDLFQLGVAVIDDRTLQPLTPPMPAYPGWLARRGIEGDCEVHLSVDPRGRPFEIHAVCTHDGFARGAERAVSRVLFAPGIANGRPVEQHNVVYPMAFRLSEN